jgi:ABC-2 type transport system ATP-binding protein
VNKGKKILDGSLSEIKNDFKEHIFKVGFEAVPDRFESNTFTVINSKENYFTVKINGDNKPAAVLQEFLNQNASIVSFNEVLPSLNEIFIRQVEDTKKAREFSAV